MLFEGFILTKGRARLLYYPIFFLQRLFIAISLIFLRISPSLQVLLCFLSASSVTPTQMFTYQLALQPFLDPQDRISSFTTEGCTMLIYMILGSFLWEMDTTSKEIYEILLMAVVMTTVGVMMLLSVYKMVKTVKRLLKEYRTAVEIEKKQVVKSLWTFREARQTPEATCKPGEMQGEAKEEAHNS